MVDYLIVTIMADGRRREAVLYVPTDEAARKSFQQTWEGAPDAAQGRLLRVDGKVTQILGGGWRVP